MKTVVWLLGLLLAFVTGAAAFVFSGSYNVAADEPHWGLTKYLMETARTRSIAARSSGVRVPALEIESLIRAGAGNYDAMCTGCHLKPGLESTEQSKGLYPIPPDLTDHPIDDPAAAFWTIKHGVKMTGMPAWGKSMEDDYIWGMVAFLQKLPDLTPDRYNALVAASGGHRHGGTETAQPAADADVEHEPAEHSHVGAQPHAKEPHAHDDDHSKAPPHQH